jgi:hypothetical protein
MLPCEHIRSSHMLLVTVRGLEASQQNHTPNVLAEPQRVHLFTVRHTQKKETGNFAPSLAWGWGDSSIRCSTTSRLLDSIYRRRGARDMQSRCATCQALCWGVMSSVSDGSVLYKFWRIIGTDLGQ